MKGRAESKALSKGNKDWAIFEMGLSFPIRVEPNIEHCGKNNGKTSNKPHFDLIKQSQN